MAIGKHQTIFLYINFTGKDNMANYTEELTEFEKMLLALEEKEVPQCNIDNPECEACGS